MIQTLYSNICAGQNVRKSLIELRQLIKDANNKRAFYYELDGDFSVLESLLQDEDAKVRKNVVLIMGDLKIEDFKPLLLKAYENEEKLFIRSDYLTALSCFDCSDLQEVLKTRLFQLSSKPVEENNKKHINEELRLLTQLTLKLEEPQKHEFNGYKVLSDMILLTNRDHQQVTLDQITKGKAKAFGAGIMVRTEDLKEILRIRTYSDLLFKLPEVSTVEAHPEEAAQTLFEGGLLNFLLTRHKGYPPFYFRIEVKSKMALDKRSTFTKRLASELERISNRQLINSTSHYEFEIRLIENKEGRFNVLLKLFTIEDKRFSYRKKTLAVSIAPSTAALTMQLAKPYLKEEAQVLDPFCGVGTILIERQKVEKAKVLYGVDIYGEAIDHAIENANWASTDIYLINRDFFDFTHKYLFDELITNMPTAIGRKTQGEIVELYALFFQKAHTMMEANSVMILYSRDKDLVERGLANYPHYYQLEKTWTISKKEESYVFIITVNQVD
ncbi:methyltransferase [Niameybacter massiliensis]|uniref:methyltransferase n=1 Tax=Niameybacter massiliensis TaxID=1658108 RepID=UPI0006B4AF13|nr:methyltransferase [Niameybacter massiliensis]